MSSVFFFFSLTNVSIYWYKIYFNFFFFFNFLLPSVFEKENINKRDQSKVGDKWWFQAFSSGTQKGILDTILNIRMNASYKWCVCSKIQKKFVMREYGPSIIGSSQTLETYREERDSLRHLGLSNDTDRKSYLIEFSVLGKVPAICLLNEQII